MPQNNSTLKLLDIKDPNVKLYDNFYAQRKIKNTIHKIIFAKLTYTPKACYKCGHVFDEKIIKHGYKKTKIKMLSNAGYPTLLELDKQRYKCGHCDGTFTLQTSLVDKHCSISKKTKLAIAIDAKDKISEKDIAKKHNVSGATVSRIIDHSYKIYKPRRNYLPKNLLFDEFKSVKEASGAMSFIFVDADSKEIIDIVENRKLFYLRKYFLSFTKKARRAVKNIVIDMYSPYMTLIKAMFPNARIIIDKFHLVQLYHRALNKTRIETMNALTDKSQYKKLKAYWKLILKDQSKLDYSKLRYNKRFKKQMTQAEILRELLTYSDQLKASYELYQDILASVRLKNINTFKKSIASVSPLVSEHMKTAIKTTKKYDEYISNMLHSNYTNGPIEGINNKIKVIKRIAFGYRSFTHFRNRILITQGTLKLKTV